ncbi:MAG: hypothetical protein JWP29_3220 [Rhodoferax sp.]|nr:hypothetical protein [Rhodoferax sp.]
MAITQGKFFSRTVGMDSGHEITVTLRRTQHFDIDTIDLETRDLDDLETPAGGPYDTEEEALAAAKVMAAHVLG